MTQLTCTVFFMCLALTSFGCGRWGRSEPMYPHHEERREEHREHEERREEHREHEERREHEEGPHEHEHHHDDDHDRD
jgi:hypothetical protein